MKNPLLLSLLLLSSSAFAEDVTFSCRKVFSIVQQIDIAVTDTSPTTAVMTVNEIIRGLQMPEETVNLTRTETPLGNGVTLIDYVSLESDDQLQVRLVEARGAANYFVRNYSRFPNISGFNCTP